MLEIYHYQKNEESFIFVYQNYYLLSYSRGYYGEVIIMNYYHQNLITNAFTKLNLHDIIFDQNIKKSIRKFLKIKYKELLNGALDDSKREILTAIKRRDELEDLILGIRYELKKILSNKTN